jgi:ELWxxDGT repeat protein
LQQLTPVQTASSWPTDLMNVQGTLLFAANGNQLWKSDGTEAGTLLVTNFGYSIDAVAALGQRFYVAAEEATGTQDADGFYQTIFELWVTDGTPQGTLMLKDYVTSNNDPIHDLVPVGTNLFFSSFQLGLWKTDGTLAGTTLVSDHILDETGYPQGLTVLDGSLFYFADSDELWRSDGTQAGTQLVGSGLSGPSPPSGLVNANGTLFFSGDDGTNGAQLWKSDGTPAGTVMVTDINPLGDSNPANLVAFDNAVFFSANDGTTGQQLWRSDGTPGGTFQVADINPNGDSYPSNLVSVGATLFFSADDGISGRELWKTDGTNTVPIMDINQGPGSSNPSDLVDVGGTLYFVADDGTHGRQLWRSDGTNTALVKVFHAPYPGYDPAHLTAVNGTLFLSADDGVHGEELWKSDGTAAGTVMVKDINTQGSRSIYDFRAWLGIDSTLFFTMSDYNTGGQLWKSDGTPGGTLMVTDILPAGQGPENFANLNGTLFFSLFDPVHGEQLWKSSGTAADTRMVSNSTNFWFLLPTPASGLVSNNGLLFFSADDGQHGVQLWTSDGSTLGTSMVADINPNGSSNPRQMAPFGPGVLFQADDGTGSAQLWKSDGTTEGTQLVKTVNPSAAWPAGLYSLTPAGTNLFFLGNDGTNTQLWKTDGTAANTVMVKSLYPGLPYSAGIVALNGLVFFTADDGTNGDQLWVSRGTASTTKVVKAINPSGSSYPENLSVVNGWLFFTADDGVNGPRLWKSDGTEANTVMVKNIPASFSDLPILDFNGLALFYGPGGSIWQSDGTDSGTTVALDTTTMTNIGYLITVNGTLFLTGDTGTTGWQLWKLEPAYTPGQEIPPPPEAVLGATPGGPVIVPPGAACWSPSSGQLGSGKLYAVLPGEITVIWTNALTNAVFSKVLVQAIPPQQYILGQEIPPPAGVVLTNPPAVTPSDAAFWHGPTRKLYATGAYSSYDIAWSGAGCAGVHVPAQNLWPDDPSLYQLHIANSPSVPLAAWGLGSEAALESTDPGTGAEVIPGGGAAPGFAASAEGRSLLLLSAGDPGSTNIYFQFVKTVMWNDPAYLYTNGMAVIGQEITNTYGFHDASLGSPWVLDSLSRYCAQTNYYDRASRTGPIIPVNQNDPSTSDQLVLVCYQNGATLVDPLSGNPLPSGIAWPCQAVQYGCQWPTNANAIVIASGLGTGPIDGNVYLNPAIYVQNDPTQPGFNPNDEHAFFGSSSNGPAIFALRDDLGTPATSQPYVLMTYQDATDANRPKIKVFKVQSGTPQYSATAGGLLQVPPLVTLQPCQESYGFAGPFWSDREFNFWARAAGNDGGPANITMRYWYPIQPGFYFPSGYFAHFPLGVSPANLPPGGTHFPWLDIRGGTPGTPIAVTFTVNWPANVPQLALNETLVKPKWGLPDISQQNSVEIIYQQSATNGHGPSVELIDPTALRQMPLAQLPADLTTANNLGYTYFPTLSPQLRDRLYYDPVNHQLDFIGQFVSQFGAQEPVGYLLLNVISSREKAVLLGLSQDPTWAAAINALGTNQIIQVPPNTPFNHPLALTAGGAPGQGYVTLAFNNSTNLALDQPADPISLAVIQVGTNVYRGQLEVIESDNPFDEKLTLRHSGDFAGQADGYTFEWRTLPPGNDGLPQAAIPPEQWNFYSPVPASGQGALDITIGGPGLFTLSDNYFVCRYRSTNVLSAAGTNWSAWTDPGSGFAPGWIKRVLQNINPFEERFSSYQDSTNDTIVSMIAQAGPPYEGVVPLNAQAADSLGLIEIYETVLQRGMSFSINGSPPVDYGPADDALLLAASRLSDLYMLLGNEAYAEASDPTIGITTGNTTVGIEAPCIHPFEDQTASRLEEELDLLRGRDDSVLPSVQTFPVYNRLLWNFTGGNGEVAYVNKFDVTTLADAQQQYPMGHGDAWGHYLSAITVYYGLLHNPSFTWVPRIESVLVGGIAVSVNYEDERKFAKAAAAKAQAGADIASLTYRSTYTNDPTQQFQVTLDSNTNRAWGLSEWGSRAGQGALFDWAVANAVLPPVSTNTGIQKVDRTSVSELGDIVAAYQSIQNEVDKADTGLNPLGLAQNMIPFDIEPSQTNGATHFEQIYSRAVVAIDNALALFNFAESASQALRSQADSVDQFDNTVANQEADFNSRLIEAFGYPYPNDIGAGGTYPQGYQGPDLYHYMYYNPATVLGIQPPPAVTFVVTNADIEVNPDGSLVTNLVPVTYCLSTNGYGVVMPAAWTGDRQAPGTIQMAQSDLWQAKGRFDQAVLTYENLIEQIEDQAALLQSQYNVNAQEISIQNATLNTQESLDQSIQEDRARELDFQMRSQQATIVANAWASGLPQQIGVIAGLAAGTVFDPSFAAREAIQLAGSVVSQIMTANANQASLAELDAQQAQQLAQNESSIQIAVLNQGQAIQQQLDQLLQLIRSEAPARLEIYTLQEALQESAGKYSSAVAQGQLILQDRLRFRQQTATQVEQYRYKDMAFRIFQNDALQKYRAQFDMAALYVYLAAAAYDYETALAPGDPNGPGSTYMTSIVKARSIGQIGSDGRPIAGSTANGDDPGLADPMARMYQNYEVLKSQFGLDNPDMQTGQFSLRSEAFRILPGAAGNDQWRNQLMTFVVSNILAIPEFQRYCIPPSPLLSVEPGIVIPFSTTINFGENFFGWPASGGDYTYDSSHFATKIRSEGVWFANYNSLSMSQTPYVYLIPVGSDVLRVPGGSGATRQWKILEQLLPVPYPANPSTPNWIPINDTLGDQFYAIRRYPSLLAYNDGGSFNAGQVTSSSRLIGRSVWNTGWLLIIPAGTLLSDRNEAIQRFINGSLLPNGQRDGNGISDIKIYFQSSSYPGY